LQDDPLHYAQLINRVLSSCKYIVADQQITQPITDTSQLPRGVFWWKTVKPITLHSRERIAVKDNRLYRVVKPSAILQVYDADYALLDGEQQDKVIFRFCTHGKSLPAAEPAHVHDSANVRIEEGDGRLNGQSLVGADFLLFFKYVCSYLDGNKLPWQ
jgi:hypothetical protein